MPDEQKPDPLHEDNPIASDFSQSGEPALITNPELARVESELKMPEVPSVGDIPVVSGTPVTPVLDESPTPATVTSAIPEFSPGAEASVVLVTPPKKRKKWLVAAVVVGAVVLLGGGGAAAYTFWYQTPEKVLGDAFANALQAKSVIVTGNITSSNDSSGSTAVNVTLKSGDNQGQIDATVTVKYGVQTIEVSGAGIYDKDGNLYIKVNDVKKLLDTVAGSSMNDVFGNVVTKIDNKWIKVAASDLKDVSEDYSKVQTCVSSAQSKFASDKSARDEIIKTYKGNNFVVVKENLGTKDGSLGYVIDTDQAKVKSFVTALNETTLAKDLVKCDSTLAFNADDITSDSADDSSTARVEVWVTQFTHQFSKLSVSGTSDGTTTSMVLQPTFNGNVTVTVPTEVVPLSELQADIEAAYQKWYTETMNGYEYDSTMFETTESSLLDI